MCSFHVVCELVILVCYISILAKEELVGMRERGRGTGGETSPQWGVRRNMCMHISHIECYGRSPITTLSIH